MYKYYIDDSNFIYLAPNVHFEADGESGYTCQFSLIFLRKLDTEYFIKYNTTKKQQADLRQFYFCTLVQQFENMRKFAPNKKNVISHQKINEQFNFLFTGAIHRKPHYGGNLQKVHDSLLLNPYIKEFVKKVPTNFGHKIFLYLRNNEHMKSNIQEMVKKSVFLSWANKQY